MDQGLLTDFFEEEKTHWWHAAKRRMIGIFLPQGHGRALVLGVGGGRLCFELAKHYEVVAVDISPIACQHVKDNYAVEALVCDLNQLPGADHDAANSARSCHVWR